jgi:hypothetical protein
LDFILCFRKNIKNIIMGKVHSNEDVNWSQGQACFERKVAMHVLMKISIATNVWKGTQQTKCIMMEM